MNIKSLVLVGFLVVTTSGCVTNQTKGQIIGGGLGGALGSQVGGGSGRIAATVVGTMAGAFIGGGIGNSMDETERLRLEMERNRYSRQYASSAPSYFYDDNPAADHIEYNYQSCRKEQSAVTINGLRQAVFKIMCRQPNGHFAYMH